MLSKMQVYKQDDKGRAWQPRALRKLLLLTRRPGRVGELINFERLQPRKLKGVDPGRHRNS